MRKPVSKKHKKAEHAYTGDDVKRYVGAIMEEVRDGFKATNEVLSGINKKLDNHHKRLEDTEKEQNITRVRIGDHETRISNIENKVQV